jgi:hypothetical protein
MSRAATSLLLALFLVLAIANSYAINEFDRSYELYPMTAWQMFSGRPKKVARKFVFEVVATANTEPMEVEAEDMFLVGLRFGGTPLRRVMTGIWKSTKYKCSGYKLKNYSDCLKDPTCPWVIPEDIASRWLECSIAILDLSAPPYSITPILIEYSLDDKFQAMLDSGERINLFTWYPSSGGYAVEDQIE